MFIVKIQDIDKCLKITHNASPQCKLTLIHIFYILQSFLHLAIYGFCVCV